MPGTGYPYNVFQTTLSCGLEAVRGTAAATPLWMPVKAPKYKPDRTLIEDNTLQGSAVEVYDIIPGLQYDAHGWDGFPYLDTFGTLVAGLLGSADTKTTAPTSTTLLSSAVAGAASITTVASVAIGTWITIGSGATQETHLTTNVAAGFVVTLAGALVYGHASTTPVTCLTKHQWSLLNTGGAVGDQPSSVTITDYDGEEWRQLTACQVDQLTIKGNASGLIEYTVSFFGNPSVTPSTPTPSFGTVTHAPPGWTTQTIVGGTQLSYIEDWEFDLSRGVKPVPGVTGTKAYFAYQANALKATGKMTVIEQSGAPELTAFQAGTKESFDFTFYDYYSGFGCNLHSTSSQFKTGSLDRGATGEVKAALDFQCIPTTTDALAGGVSPVIVSIGNATTTALIGT